MDDPYIANELKEFFKKMKEHRMASLFLQPIEEIIASFPLYTQIISKPIDMIKIEQKINEDLYTFNLLEIEDFKSDMDLMFSNCKIFNTNKTHWVYKQCVSFEDHFSREWKKFIVKLQKYSQIQQANTSKINNSQKLNKIESNSLHGNNDINMNYTNNNLNSSNNIQIVSNSDDEKIGKRIKNLFQKIASNLNLTDIQRDEIISHIVKSISKRNKTFDIIYEDTMKFLSKNLTNDNMKSYFGKKFRKLLRSIKEEHNDGVKATEQKAFNIKINLDENEEKREEKDKLEQIRKDVLNFIDNQKIPEVFRNAMEYPIEPGLRKKVTLYVKDVRNSFITHY